MAKRKKRERKPTYMQWHLNRNRNGMKEKRRKEVNKYMQWNFSRNRNDMKEKRRKEANLNVMEFKQKLKLHK